MCLEIEKIKARQILDSRGLPTIEAEVELANGNIGCASVPSGASTGTFEAIELRDKIKNNFHGKSVMKAVENIENIIAQTLYGEDASNQRCIDNLMLELDGSFNKSNLGANAILAVSLACAKATALSYQLPLYKYLGGINANILPTPMINVINGGKHSNNSLDFQEFMISPVGFSTFSDSIKAGAEIFQTLKLILQELNYSTNVGDEGGFAPDISSPEEAIELIIKAIEKTGYSTNNVKICLDIAASELFEPAECSGGICSVSKYILHGTKQTFTTDGLIDYLENLISNYPIVSIEDGLAEDDELGWIELTKRIGNKCQLVGDDLFVTNVERLSGGIKKNIANSILIKPNQIGTLSETFDTIQLAKINNYSSIISHRSGETEDTFIADLAVAMNTGLIKIGSLSRSDRVAKYNRLLKIEEELAENANFLGLKAFKGIKNDPPPYCNF